MRWADVELDAGWWSIPGLVAKNAQPHRVPLTQARPGHPEGPPADGERERNLRLREPSRRRIDSAPSKKVASVLCRSLTFTFKVYDLRWTAATRMAEAGVPRDHIAKVLNHVKGSPAATRVYESLWKGRREAGPRSIGERRAQPL
jgi:integrase